MEAVSPQEIECPVCWLFLRPGMSLEQHLAIHSHSQVIVALVRILSTTRSQLSLSQQSTSTDSGLGATQSPPSVSTPINLTKNQTTARVPSDDPVVTYTHDTNNLERIASTNSDGHRSTQATNEASCASPELDKACQTQTPLSDDSPPHTECDETEITGEPQEEIAEDENDSQTLYETPEHGQTVEVSTSHENFEQSDVAYTTVNILRDGEDIDLNSMDINNMPVIIGGYSDAPILSSTSAEQHDQHALLNLSQDPPSLEILTIRREKGDPNIRTDEKMPPRGELSGQESMGGASDVGWSGHGHYEVLSGRRSTDTITTNSNHSWSNHFMAEDCSRSAGTFTHKNWTGGENSFSGAGTSSNAGSITVRRAQDICARTSENGRRFGLVGNKKRRSMTSITPVIPYEAGESMSSNAIDDDLSLPPPSIDPPTSPAFKFSRLVTSSSTTIEPPVDERSMSGVRLRVDEHNGELVVEEEEVDMSFDMNQDGDNDEEEGVEVVAYSGSPNNFQCSSCNEAFASSKDRKQHVLEHHHSNANTFTSSLIGLDINRKQLKKLVIKPKVQQSNDENVIPELKTEVGEDYGLVDSKIDITKLDLLDASPTTAASQLSTSNCMNLRMCTICDALLPSRKALRIHQVEQHKYVNNSVHRCQVCQESFPNQRTFNAHLYVHPLECKSCGKQFFAQNNYALHVKRHLGIKAYKCDICSKSFVTKQSRDEHRNIHTGNAPIKCPDCEQTFKRYSNLVQHRKKYHLKLKVVRDYVCHCGSVYHSRKKLEWHQEIHDPQPKACTECSQKFVHMSSLTRHMRKSHNAEYLPDEKRESKLNVNAACPICNGIYLRSSLEAHIRGHNGDKPFACPTCQKDFTTKWNLKLHMFTHAPRTQKPFKCSLCRSAFIRENDFVAHMNSHKDLRPYTCNHCGTQFIRKTNWIRHEREHENAKTFDCGVCGKAFHRSYYLKDHMRVHSGVRPYCCNFCGKTSTTKSNHNKHVKTHDTKEPMPTEN